VPACTLHPQIETAESCGLCGRPFCDRCTVEILGQHLCEGCKGHAVGQLLRPRRQHPTVMWSLLLPLIGYFGCQVLIPATSIAGIVMARKALAEIAREPGYTGRSVGLVALVVSWGTLVTWTLAVGVSFWMAMQNR
jgi:hypothetical protein